MRKPIAIINHESDDYLRIVYLMTNVCNYKCNYCWPESHSGTTRWSDFEKICKGFDHIISVYKTSLGKKRIRFHFLGGEPTLWPRLGNFAKYIYDRHGCRITMSTNGSRTIRWWEENYKYFDDIQLSVHHEMCDVDHLKNVADLLYAKREGMVSLAVMMDPLAWDKCYDIVTQLVEHPTPWLVKAIMLRDVNDAKVRKEYSQEQLDFFKDKIKKIPPDDYISKMKEIDAIQQDHTNADIHFNNGDIEKYKTFNVATNGWNQFNGWSCSVFQNSIAISPAGDFAGNCGERKTSNGQTFNIFDDDFVETFTADAIGPIRCRTPVCGCSTDIRLTKWKYLPKDI